MGAHGSGFSSASEAAGYLLCRVGGAARRARWASARALSCAVGRSRAGEARLEASNNAREYSADAERPAARRDGGRRARGGRAGGRRAVRLRRGGGRRRVGGLARRRRVVVVGRGGRGGVGRAVRVARERGDGVGGRAAGRAGGARVERRQLLLPRLARGGG